MRNYAQALLIALSFGLILFIVVGCGAGVGPSYWGLTTLQVGLAQ